MRTKDRGAINRTGSNLYQKTWWEYQKQLQNPSRLYQAGKKTRSDPVGEAFADALGTALGFAVAIVTLGAVRELFGAGTLFAGTQDLLGALGSDTGITLLPEGFRLGVLRTPPGAFLAAGILLALGQWLFVSRGQKTNMNNE